MMTSQPPLDDDATNDPQHYVSILHACALVKVSRRTMYNWMEAKKVRFKFTPGGSRRIFRPDLMLSDTLTDDMVAAKRRMNRHLYRVQDKP